MRYQTYARRPVSQTLLVQLAKFCVQESGVTWKDAVAKGRGHAGVMWARQLAQYILRECTGAGLQQIGAVFKKDHATVLYSHRLVQDFMEVYPETRAEVEALKTKVMNLMRGDSGMSVVSEAA